MNKHLARYYAWRRRRLRKAGKKNRKYQRFGLKWYKNYPHSFAGGPLYGDLTGLNLSWADKDQISRIPGDKEIPLHYLRVGDDQSTKVDFFDTYVRDTLCRFVVRNGELERPNWLTEEDWNKVLSEYKESSDH